MSIVRRRGVVSVGASLALCFAQGAARAQPPGVAPAPPPDPAPAPQQPDPSPAQPAGPQAPAPTRAAFLSDGAQPWDVVVDGQPSCATPCSLQLQPWQFVTLQSQESNPVIVEVGRLPVGDVVVTGKPLEEGMYAGGIVATTFGGMALVVGITLTAVGLAKGRSGMTTAGLISGGAGAVAVAGGIYLMVNAAPSAAVHPAAHAFSGGVVSLAGAF